MSADLFAAFGSDQPVNSGEQEGEQIPTSTAAPQVFQRPKSLANDYTAPAPRERPLWEKDHAGTDILFDAAEADDVEDEDGFGDFEDAEPVSTMATVQSRQQTAFVDLLDLSVDIQPLHQDQRLVHRDPQGNDPFAIFSDAGLPTPLPDGATRSTSVTDGPDDDWGEFETIESTNPDSMSMFDSEPRQTTHRLTTPVDVSEDDWESFGDEPAKASESHLPASVPTSKLTEPIDARPNLQTSSITPKNTVNDSERPTNIPPPSGLLQILPGIVQLLSLEAKPSSDSDHTIAIAKKIQQLYSTISRIISGRSHRWKRDTILAQSMRISFAGQKNSGMKLQSLDRGESVREEQEALEVAAAWSKYNHILNAALSRAKLKKPAMSLSSDMKIRTATGLGILTSKESCAVCGLKRNERVLGIDINVDDVFGEFWVDYWGHRDCMEWWRTYKNLLKQR